MRRIFVPSENKLWLQNAIGLSAHNLRERMIFPFGKPTAEQHSDCGANEGELVLLDCSIGNLTVNLQNIFRKTVGGCLTIKKVSPDTNTLTIRPAPGNTINGASSLILDKAYAAATIKCISPTEWVTLRQYGYIAPYIGVTYVVGRNGKIWHRSAAGVWTDHSIGTMGANDNFYGVHGVSENEAYAVGFTFGTTISNTFWYKWNGSTWSVWSSIPSLPSDRGPTAIFCFASNDIFLAAASGTASTNGLLYHWDGISWTLIDSGTYKPYALWGTSASDLYIACRVPGNAELKKWDGSSISNSSSISGGDCLNHMHGSSNGTIFSCGGQVATNGIWRGVWDSFSADSVSGITMNAQQVIQGWNNIYSASGKAWAFGLNASNYPAVAIYDSSWSMTALKSQIYSIDIAVTGISSNDIIAVYGDYGGASVPPDDAAAFIWNGNDWSVENVGDGGTFFPTDAWKSSSA